MSASDWFKEAASSPILSALLASGASNSTGALAEGRFVVPAEVIQHGARAALKGKVDNLTLVFSERALEAAFDVDGSLVKSRVRVSGTSQRYAARSPLGDILLDADTQVELDGNVVARIFAAILLALSRGIFGASVPLRALRDVEGIEMNGRAVTCHLDRLAAVRAHLLEKRLGVSPGELIDVRDIAFVEGGVCVIVKPTAKLEALRAAGSGLIDTVKGQGLRSAAVALAKSGAARSLATAALKTIAGRGLDRKDD